MIPARKLFAALSLGALGTAIALSAAPLVAGCSGRFPTCQTNADCQGRDGGKLGNVCYNLRCVECHYDSDCALGQVCTPVGACSSIDSRQKDLEQKEEGTGDGGLTEPVTWDECAQRCKEQGCVEECDRKFHPK
jgi:hypothetical protein